MAIWGFFAILLSTCMGILNRKESLVLAIGDVVSFVFSLWLMLFLRYNSVPDRSIVYAHIAPFSLLFVVWLIVFFVAGLYEKHTLLFQSRLPKILLQTGMVNILIAVILFYFVPSFGIAPKANLFIYLCFSSASILMWRMYGYQLFYKAKKQNALIIGTGEELLELVREVNANKRYPVRFVSSFEIQNINAGDFERTIVQTMEDEGVTLVALDMQNERLGPLLPSLYKLVFRNVEFVDIHELYEEIFDRIPLSRITNDWFLEHVPSRTSAGYDSLKRLMDIVIALPLLAIPLITYPLAWIAMKIEDGGSVLIYQNRVGKNNRSVRLLKFRTMLFNDEGDWKEKGKQNRVTKVGAFLRKTRLDEFPQLWNVLKGDISLIGPRPEFLEAVKQYVEKIPYYDTRHLIEPGLSGWAQLYHDNHPHHKADVEETRVKLSYDLYYIKNRSFFLDLKIALKTIKTLLSRSGV